MVDKFCDNCGAHATTPGKIYRLDLGGNSELIFVKNVGTLK